jgi:hypothetical protein
VKESKRSELVLLKVIRLDHRLLLEVLDATDAESHQNLMQGFFYRGVSGVLLKVHQLLKVHFVLTVSLSCRLHILNFVVAD